MEDVNREIKQLMEQKKLILGQERTMKLLRQGNIRKIFLASNAPPSVQESLAYYNTISPIEVVGMPVINTELGTLCKRPFPISIIGVLKE